MVRVQTIMATDTLSSYLFQILSFSVTMKILQCNTESHKFLILCAHKSSMVCSISLALIFTQYVTAYIYMCAILLKDN